MGKYSLLRRVHLHGPLRIGNEAPIEVLGDTVFEVIDRISRQLSILQPNPLTGKVRLTISGVNLEEDLHINLNDQIDIHVFPQMAGGKSAMTQIVIGATLVALAFVNPIAGTKLATMMISMGAMQALGGIAQLLAPTPTNDTPDGSLYLGSPGNTTKIGTSIPILYGKFRCPGHILSFDINAIEFRGTGAGGNSAGK